MTPEQAARVFSPTAQKHYYQGCEDTIDRVLKIIVKDPGGYGACMRIKESVIKLRKGEQE